MRERSNLRGRLFRPVLVHLSYSSEIWWKRRESNSSFTGCKPVVLPLNDAPKKVVAAPGVEPGNVLVYETELVPTSPHQCTKLGPRAGMEPASPGYEWVRLFCI